MKDLLVPNTLYFFHSTVLQVFATLMSLFALFILFKEKKNLFESRKDSTKNEISFLNKNLKYKIILTFGISTFIMIWSLFSLVVVGIITRYLIMGYINIIFSFVLCLINLLMYYKLIREQIFDLKTESSLISSNNNTFTFIKVFVLIGEIIKSVFFNLKEKKKKKKDIKNKIRYLKKDKRETESSKEQ